MCEISLSCCRSKARGSFPEGDSNVQRPAQVGVKRAPLGSIHILLKQAIPRPSDWGLHRSLVCEFFSPSVSRLELVPKEQGNSLTPPPQRAHAAASWFFVNYMEHEMSMRLGCADM